MVRRISEGLSRRGIPWDYVALVEPASFEPVKQAEPGQVLATAARVGRTRLIDNVIL